MMPRKVLVRTIAVGAAAVMLLAASSCSREKNPNAAATSAATTASAGGVGGSHSGETYYWISQNSTLPLFVANDYPAWKDAAAQLGVKQKMVGPTTIDLQAFIATIDQVCAQHPAGVSVVGWDPSLTASVNKCIAEGVPTVTDDADLPNSNRLAFIGTNWYGIGVAQAQAIMANAKPGPVATLSIIAADNMTQARKGYEDTLKGSGFTIVANEDDTGSAETAATKTAALLAAHPDLVGISGFDSESGAGIVRALTEASKAGKIAVTAMEQTPEFFKTVKDGTVDAIIIQKRALFTYYALKTLYDYNHNGQSIDGLSKQEASPVPVNIDTGLLVATKANIDKILAAQGQK